MQIPADWDDVDARWMTAALAERFPGSRVARVELLMRSDGSNRRARFGVECAAGSAPSTVFLKAEGAHRETHARNGNLFNEARLAASGVELPLDHPEPYAVVVDEPELDWLVVMEDLTSSADLRDATSPMNTVQAANGLRGLARLHSRYWNFSAVSHPALAWVQTWAATEGFQEGLRRMVPRGLERGEDVLPPAVARLGGDEVVDLWARYVALLDRDPVTLLHADAHIGNTYVRPDDAVGFLDWQVTRRGHWSQDVGHFLPGALTVEDRRATERELLDTYLAALDRGVAANDAWRWYRASVVYGLAIWLSTLGTDGYQSREVSAALAERFAAAFVELDSVEALDALTARATRA
jgi:aminoglycoside phosphotransferase (APT) family kinase protein